MKRATLLAGLLLLAASPVTRGQAAIQAPAGFPPIGEPARITVVSTGAEPRKALRYVVPIGYRAHMNMDMAMSMGASTEGDSMPPTEMPPMRIGADLAVTGVSPTGDISYSLAFSSLNVVNVFGFDPAVIAHIQAMSTDFKTITGTAIVSNRGISREVHIDVSKAADPQFTQMMESVNDAFNGISMPFPEEAVGLGARWEVREAIMSSGLTMFQTVRCELTSLEGKSAVMKVTLDQTAPSQPMKSPGFSPGADVTAETIAGSGSGTMNVSLDALVPTSQATTKNTIVMTMNVGGNKSRMTVETTMKVSIAPEKK